MAGRTVIGGGLTSPDLRKDFKVEGLKQALDNVKKVLTSISGREAKQVFYDAGVKVRDEIRRQAPVDDGDLKEAIFANWGSDNKLNVLVGIGYQKASHARLVEYGTEKRYTKAGKYTGYVNANPFVRRSIAASAGAVKSTIIDGLRRVAMQHTRP